MNRANNLYNYIMSDKKKRVKVWASDMLGDNADLKQRLSRLKVGQKVKFIFDSDITVENSRSGIRVVFEPTGHRSG